MHSVTSAWPYGIDVEGPSVPLSTDIHHVPSQGASAYAAFACDGEPKPPPLADT
jgi:hypothetical protein